MVSKVLSLSDSVLPADLEHLLSATCSLGSPLTLSVSTKREAEVEGTFLQGRSCQRGPAGGALLWRNAEV